MAADIDLNKLNQVAAQQCAYEEYLARCATVEKLRRDAELYREFLESVHRLILLKVELSKTQREVQDWCAENPDLCVEKLRAAEARGFQYDYDVPVEAVPLACKVLMQARIKRKATVQNFCEQIAAQLRVA